MGEPKQALNVPRRPRIDVTQLDEPTKRIVIEEIAKRLESVRTLLQAAEQKRK